MLFTSTRNRELSVNFSKAVTDCRPADGGIFVPSSIEDMRRWIYYIDGKTSFVSIAGSLTSALMNEEFSPIICEKIATEAFPVEPKVQQLDEHLFFMELYNGFTGYHRDYGVSYLCSYLETTLQLNGGNAILFDFTNGGLGPLLAKLLKGKKHIKAVLAYRKGTVCGLKDEDYVWNGGNIYPLEMEGSDDQIRSAVSTIFSDNKFVLEHGLTAANTINVCRLLGQMFFFPYSFAQIKDKVEGDIYYAMDAQNYGTLIAGLYSWRFALPVSGFLVPSTPSLYKCDSNSTVSVDCSSSSFSGAPNLERLVSFFDKNELMMRNFVFPSAISEKQREKAAKELYMKYGLFADKETASAYAVVKENGQELFDEDGSIVLMGYNHPALSADYCRHVTGETPEMPENIKAGLVPVELGRPIISSIEELKKIVERL